MAGATPELHDNLLRYTNGGQEYSIALGSPAWWEWLEQSEVVSFRCTSFAIHFTVRKEHKQSGQYWYAYNKQKQKLYKVYLGKSTELTQTHLQKCAETLAMRLQEAGPVKSVLEKIPLAEAQKAPYQESSLDHQLSSQPQQEAADDLLLHTKFSPTGLRPHLVARPELSARLDQGTQHKFTLIAAPAGSGKSTLLSTWFQAMLNKHKAVAWISLDTKDNNPILFWKVLIQALVQYIPTLAQLAMSLTASAGPSSSATQEEALSRLIQALQASHRELTLVLDDYHLITTPTIHQMWIFLLEHLPEQIHIIIATRNDPPFPLARWRVQGDLREIRMHELRFTQQESSIFFKQEMALNLSSSQIEALQQRTEGWVAGLQLAGISLQGQHDPQQFIATFSGSHGHIVAYLGEEVLKQQAAQIQEFLLHTSILEQFNSELCDDLLQRQDSQETLKTLEQANLFINSLDGHQHWYRYHHLFAEFLNNHLQHTSPEQVAPLHKRAAAWYMQHDYTTDALNLLLKVQDFTLAARYLEQSTEQMLNRGEIATIIYWVERLPRELVNALPHLSLTYAGALCATDQLDAAALHIQEAEHIIQGLERLQATTHTAVTDQNGHTLKELQCSLSILQTVLAGFQGNVALTLERMQRAQELLAGENISSQSILVAALGTAYALSGDLEAANRTFMQAETVGYAANNAHVLLASTSGQAYFLLEQGQFQRAAERYEQILRLLEAPGQHLYSAASMIYLGLGEINYYLNNLPAAERLLKQGMELGQQWGFMTLLTRGTLFLSLVKQAQSDLAAAEIVVQELEQKSRQWYVDAVVRLVGAIRANLWLAQGKRDLAAHWAHSAELKRRQATDYRDELSGIIQTQILTAQGDLEAAENVLDQLLLAAESGGRYRNVLHILIRQAMLYQRQEKIERAQTTLLRALADAEAEGVVRIFIDEGSEMQVLLAHVQVTLTQATDKHAERLPSRQFISQIIRGIEQQRIESSRSRTASGDVKQGVQLTERERDVLTHLVHGATNQQIADALVLEVSTVKWYLKQIYHKIGTHNRLQVVLRARELHLTE